MGKATAKLEFTAYTWLFISEFVMVVPGQESCQSSAAKTSRLVMKQARRSVL